MDQNTLMWILLPTCFLCFLISPITFFIFCLSVFSIYYGALFGFSFKQGDYTLSRYSFLDRASYFLGMAFCLMALTVLVGPFAIIFLAFPFFFYYYSTETINS